jgi:ribonuclease G
VLVEIVEPHMYDVDDAVAKIDGYIISIAGASPYVGEKRMVRIDQVGRTAASALLLDESGEVVSAPARAPQAVRALDTRANTLTGAGGRGRRRSPASSGGARGAAEQAEPRSRRRRAPIDSEDAEARREAGLSESPTSIDTEPEEELAVEVLAAADAPANEGAEDGLQSKPRRRGRRGGRRRSAAKAKATPE